MITVEEARKNVEIAKQAPFKILKEQMDNISEAITKASKLGSNTIYVKINGVQYPYTVMNRVEDYGYKVDIIVHDGIEKFRISWE